MFYLDYFFKNLVIVLKLLLKGEWRRVFLALYARVYQKVYHVIFPLKAPKLRSQVPPLPAFKLEVITDHPVAYSSPDHLVPFGTKYNNSTNRKFVLRMNEIFRALFPNATLAFMDLGCSGGQLVKDFQDLNWIAAGLEGSDYSLKHRRANWAALANKNLFTCDITKPFRVKCNQADHKFHLITAWEVLEHIRPEDLPALFDNIRAHLVEGGCFIASTNSLSSVVDGVELHQTRMSNTQWREYVAAKFPDLEPVDFHLKIYHYVRYDFGEPSFLLFRKKASKQIGKESVMTASGGRT
ncbi:MAG: methyltransferase [Verrucomicrobia bacterium]|nr:methyltransferase [Verrucomicrobiota bacterium]